MFVASFLAVFGQRSFRIPLTMQDMVRFHGRGLYLESGCRSPQLCPFVQHQFFVLHHGARKDASHQRNFKDLSKEVLENRYRCFAPNWIDRSAFTAREQS
ncbi:hypothetical protein CEXT_540271 [Caerostris extrusa]|uniref:Secreted protein n=1 Tax=Caerostris extrusa TaxID=172846 RepID=A0AAV4WCR0_CAEEX|nr:hypothetical protein CEXT_540271 [Caerostris extrusa]